MKTRYFEVCKADNVKGLTVIEYPVDFGAWRYASSEFRRSSVTHECAYNFGSNFQLNNIQYSDALWMVVSTETRWEHVNIDIASNPLSQRKPAMKGRKR